MICKKCNCVIDDDCEICPACGKDPLTEKKSISPATIAALCVCVLLMCLTFFTYSKLNAAKKAFENASATTLNVTVVVTEPESIITTTADLTQAVTTTTAEIHETTSAYFDENATLAMAYISKFSFGNSSGESSQYANVLITKQQLKKTTNDEFSAFYNSRVTSDDYSWFTIVCDDGTGIVFFKSKAIAIYGEIDSMGLISKVYGIISCNSDSVFTYTELVDGYYPANHEITTTQAETYSSAIIETTNTSQPQASTPPSAKPTEITTFANNDIGSTVYITASGTKYHTADCSYLSKSKIAIDISQAKSEGYEPCSRCKP